MKPNLAARLPVTRAFPSEHACQVRDSWPSNGAGDVRQHHRGCERTNVEAGVLTSYAPMVERLAKLFCGLTETDTLRLSEI